MMPQVPSHSRPTFRTTLSTTTLPASCLAGSYEYQPRCARGVMEQCTLQLRGSTYGLVVAVDGANLHAVARDVLHEAGCHAAVLAALVEGDGGRAEPAEGAVAEAHASRGVYVHGGGDDCPAVEAAPGAWEAGGGVPAGGRAGVVAAARRAGDVRAGLSVHEPTASQQWSRVVGLEERALLTCMASVGWGPHESESFQVASCTAIPRTDHSDTLDATISPRLCGSTACRGGAGPTKYSASAS